MTDERFADNLASWLHEEAAHRVPDHLGELERAHRGHATAAVVVEPRKVAPHATTLRLAPAPRAAWLLLILVLAAVLAVAALAVGSRHRPAPPFGPARNGAILYGADNNDIDAMDPVTGASTALIIGSSIDHDPTLSPDGTRFFFVRDSTVPDPVQGNLEPIVMVANADGSDVRAIAGPLANAAGADWAPDGSRVYVLSDVDSTPNAADLHRRWIDPAGHRQHPRARANFVQFDRTGSRLIFRGAQGDASGIYEVGADGTGLRTIVSPTAGLDAPIRRPTGRRSHTSSGARTASSTSSTSRQAPITSRPSIRRPRPTARSSTSPPSGRRMAARSRSSATRRTDIASRSHRQRAAPSASSGRPGRPARTAPTWRSRPTAPGSWPSTRPTSRPGCLTSRPAAPRGSPRSHSRPAGNAWPPDAAWTTAGPSIGGPAVRTSGASVQSGAWPTA